MQKNPLKGRAGKQLCGEAGWAGRLEQVGAHCSRRWMVVAGSLVVVPRRSAARPAPPHPSLRRSAGHQMLFMYTRAEEAVSLALMNKVLRSLFRHHPRMLDEMWPAGKG